MFEYLQRVCCFMVLAEMLLHLRPSKQYERYLKMITGLISLAIVLLPACKFLTTLGNGEKIVSIEVFEQRMYEAMKEGEAKIQGELALQEIASNEEAVLDDIEKEALFERINQAVMNEGFEAKEVFVEEGCLNIVLSQREDRKIEKIQIDISYEKEKSLIENIAKELNTDETNFTVSVE